MNRPLEVCQSQNLLFITYNKPIVDNNTSTMGFVDEIRLFIEQDYWKILTLSNFSVSIT